MTAVSRMVDRIEKRRSHNPRLTNDELIELLGRDEPMAPEEFIRIRTTLDWSQKQAAEWLGRGEQMVIGYEAGRFPIPTGIARFWRLSKQCLT